MVSVSLAANIALLRQFQRLAIPGWPSAERPEPPSRLHAVADFEPNPGDLRMWSYAPPSLDDNAALVVVLHGCGQTAARYDHGAGWTTLADRYGFAVLMPEQRRANNRHRCFNWFSPEDVTRASGEVASIRAMIEAMIADHRLDRQRVFITGLSAGGAMTMAMLATYPESFAAGAVIAGMPYGVAETAAQALRAMAIGPALDRAGLGDRVRAASPHRGPWPRLSVWQGDADRTVNPANAEAILRQWLDLHDLPDQPMAETITDGHPRRVWWDRDGVAVMEAYAIGGLAHGTPLGAAEDEERYGVAGKFMLEAGISSSYHIARFFGLTGGAPRSAPPPAPDRKPGLWRRLVGALRGS